VRVDILHTRETHLHDSIISLRGEYTNTKIIYYYYFVTSMKNELGQPLTNQDSLNQEIWHP